MKIVAALLILSLTSVASAQLLTKTYCHEKATLLAAQVQVDSDRFGVGEVTRQVVLSSELKQLKGELDCRLMTIDDYCAQATPKMDMVVAAVMEEFRRGATTFDQITKAKLKQLNLKALCQ